MIGIQKRFKASFLHCEPISQARSAVPLRVVTSPVKGFVLSIDAATDNTQFEKAVNVTARLRKFANAADMHAPVNWSDDEFLLLNAKDQAPASAGLNTD